jgi:hypothetical protein
MKLDEITAWIRTSAEIYEASFPKHAVIQEAMSKFKHNLDSDQQIVMRLWVNIATTKANYELTEADRRDMDAALVRL